MLEAWFQQDITLERGHEFASYIFNACFGDHTPFEFNGNVRNFGLIDNLPYGACVEVPMLAVPTASRQPTWVPCPLNWPC